MSLMFVIPTLMIVMVVAAYILFVKFGHKLAEGERAMQLAVMAGGAEVESESDEEEGEKEEGEEEEGGGGAEEGEMHTSTHLADVAEDVEDNIIKPHHDSVSSEGRRLRKAVGKVFGPCLNIGSALSTLFQGVWSRLQGVGKRIKSLMKLLEPLMEIGSAVISLVSNLDQDLLMPMVKIMMTVFQIVSGMPNAINLKFPPHAARMFEVFAFVNFTSMNFGSPQCYYKYDYVDVLMLQTLAPLVLIALLFLAYLVDHRCRTTPMERSIYVTFFFLITYLVLPRYGLPFAPPHSFVHDTALLLFLYLFPSSYP